MRGEGLLSFSATHRPIPSLTQMRKNRERPSILPSIVLVNRTVIKLGRQPMQRISRPRLLSVASVSFRRRRTISMACRPQRHRPRHRQLRGNVDDVCARPAVPTTIESHFLAAIRFTRRVRRPERAKNDLQCGLDRSFRWIRRSTGLVRSDG